jgi:hypothetical protein
MAIRDDIFPLVKRTDWRACDALLDQASPGVSQVERKSLAYWRAVVYQHEGRDGEALDLINSSRGDFSCKCLPDYLSARILNRQGRHQEAVAVMRQAPIFEEIAQFPALALEAAYFYCGLLAQSRERAPPQLLALIPDDFQTMDEHSRFVGKGDLLDMMDWKAPSQP